MSPVIRRNALVLTSALAVAFVLGGIVGSRPVHATEVTATSQTLQSAATSGNGTAVGTGFMPRCRESVVYVVWSSGVSAGAVQIESAHDVNYTGTWAPLQTVTWATAANKEDIVQITGVHNAIRTRISTNLVGGTVTTVITCN